MQQALKYTAPGSLADCGETEDAVAVYIQRLVFRTMGTVSPLPHGNCVVQGFNNKLLPSLERPFVIRGIAKCPQLRQPLVLCCAA